MFLFCSYPVKPPDAVAQMDRATALQAGDESAERRAIALGQYQGWREGRRAPERGGSPLSQCDLRHILMMSYGLIR
jgi:hypothetical protein